MQEGKKRFIPVLSLGVCVCKLSNWPVGREMKQGAECCTIILTLLSEDDHPKMLCTNFSAAD